MSMASDFGFIDWLGSQIQKSAWREVPVCLRVHMNSWFLGKLATGSTNRKILRVALVVGFLMLLTRFGATVKELIVARSFGLNDALDAFLIAMVLPLGLTGIVTGSIGGAL